ncbi:hypothetical protein Tco_1524120 [Tanacetum coccineum]
MIIDKGDMSSDTLHKRVEVVKSIQEVDKLCAMEASQKAKIKWAMKATRTQNITCWGCLISGLCSRGELYERCLGVRRCVLLVYRLAIEVTRESRIRRRLSGRDAESAWRSAVGSRRLAGFNVGEIQFALVGRRGRLTTSTVCSRSEPILDEWMTRIRLERKIMTDLTWAMSDCSLESRAD